jgi:hypothetical protein
LTQTLLFSGALRFCDLATEYADHKEEMTRALGAVLDSTAFIMGPQVG